MKTKHSHVKRYIRKTVTFGKNIFAFPVGVASLSIYGTIKGKRKLQRFSRKHIVPKLSISIKFAGRLVKPASNIVRDNYNRIDKNHILEKKINKSSLWVKDNLKKAFVYTKKHPGKALVCVLSLSMGLKMGGGSPDFEGGFPDLDMKVLGIGGHRNGFFHSAIAPIAFLIIARKFLNYLEKQNELIKSGNLTKRKERLARFQYAIMRYVGAPLLGAFSIGVGIHLFKDAIGTKAVVGPIFSRLFRGGDTFDTIWLFGNGVICFVGGFKFFMLAKADEYKVKNLAEHLRKLQLKLS